MSKATSNRYTTLIGFNPKKGITNIRSTVCFRKPMNLPSTRQVMRKYKYAMGMVSAHNIYRKPNTPFCSIWCHCFRNPKAHFGDKPAILLSESDFVDPLSIPIVPRSKKFKWDFYYFTIGGELGDSYKGYRVFLDSLPILCGKYGLKGLLIKYAKQKARFSDPIPAKYSSNIHQLRKKIVPGRIAQIMSQCRFGFFPNVVDCSPLLLSESLVRDCPVLINQDILGGWKYGQGAMGRLFSPDDLEERIETMMEGDFSPREEFMQSYGYKNTAEKLSEFFKEHLPAFKRFSMIAFSQTRNTMMQYGC